MRHSFLYFVGTHFRIFVSTFLVHLRVYSVRISWKASATPDNIVLLFCFQTININWPEGEEKDTKDDGKGALSEKYTDTLLGKDASA